MVLHAHLCKSEVIGVIGGEIIEKGSSKESNFFHNLAKLYIVIIK